MLFEQARQGEDIAHVVVDDEHFFTTQGLIRLAQPLEHLLLMGRQVGRDQMQKQCISSSRRSGDWTSFMTTLSAMRARRELVLFASNPCR